MAFVKLDCGILDSTLWIDRESREVFITALLMAEPFETETPLPQINVRTMETVGWSVPPGWYGFVRAAGIGIVRRSGLETEAGMLALERMGLPEAESRSQDFDGRRLVRVDGGFIVLNFMRYRDRDYSGAERARRYRERTISKKNAALESQKWDSIVAFYSGLCAYCQAAPWTDIDHVVPTSKGGKHELSNVVPACKSCNSAKGARDAPSFKRHIFMRGPVTVTRDITQAEEEAELEVEEKKKKKGAVAPEPDPSDLDQVAWSRWEAYRKETKKPLKLASIAAAKRELAKFGTEQASVIEHSIANGYQGLFAPKKGKAQRRWE